MATLRRLIPLVVLLTALTVGCGEQKPLPTRLGNERLVTFNVHSRLVRRSLHEIGLVPIGPSRRRPLLVLLHGRGASPANLLSPQLVAALGRLGASAPAVLLVDGADHSYYHDRADGAWGSYVLREAIPAGIKLLHADPGRVAIGGESMGGFGALDLARLAPGRFCAVGGHSPALWRQGSDTPSGAFDDAADFARHDLLAASPAYRDSSVWIDVGTDDPFRVADVAYAARIRAKGGHVVLHVWPGGHGEPYWNSHMPAYLSFYAKALADCHAQPAAP